MQDRGVASHLKVSTEMEGKNESPPGLLNTSPVALNMLERRKSQNKRLALSGSFSPVSRHHHQVKVHSEAAAISPTTSRAFSMTALMPSEKERKTALVEDLVESGMSREYLSNSVLR
jgi:hypothetical protein